MTPNPVAALLAEVEARGIELQAHGERLRFRPRSAVTPDLAERLQAHKDELLASLSKPAPSSSSSTAGPWNQVQDDLLRAELLAEVDKIKADMGGRLPSPLDVLLADAVVIGERYIWDNEKEAGRGWDALQLLRDLIPHVRSIVENWKARQPSGIVWVLLASGRVEQYDADAIPSDAIYWCRTGDKEWTPHTLTLQEILRYNRSIEECEWVRRDLI